MKRTGCERYTIGIGLWRTGQIEDIGAAIHRELAGLGHHPSFFSIEEGRPPEKEVIFLHGPRGPFLQILQRAACAKPRPTVVCWNTQGLPDLRIPWPVMRTIARQRLRLWDLLRYRDHRPGATPAFIQSLNRRMARFFFLGQYLRAFSRDWIDVFADISAVYATVLSKQGLPVIHAPFGSMVGTHEHLAVERDIDVLWMGARATRRRSRIIDRVRVELRQRGARMYVVDGHERPFVFGSERTLLLNRSKITLNLLRVRHDENSMRFCLAAPNRSMIVSEPTLPHVPSWEPGTHYICAPLENLVDTLCHYLEHEEERLRVTEQAYRLATTKLTFGPSIAAIMEKVARRRDLELR